MVNVALGSNQLILSVLQSSTGVIEVVSLEVAAVISPHQLITQLPDARLQAGVLLQKLSVPLLDPVVLLIAGLFVVGEALFRTGVAYAIGDWLMRVAGTNENRLLILLMLVVAGLSAFMSLAGAVAIFIPLALNLAAKAGTSPSRLMMPLAASTAFSTPVASPVNTLVLGLGGYQFTDFVKVGVPLQFLAMVVNLLVVPLLFPLQ